METPSVNPLLVQWLKEWWDEARERSSKGVMTYVRALSGPPARCLPSCARYKKAYEAMKKNSLPFDHPSEASQLKWLGGKLCDRLTEKMRLHCEENGLPMPEDPRKKRKRRTGLQEEQETGEAAEQPPKKPRATKKKAYVPQLRSSPYAILLALSTLPEEGNHGLTKNEIINIGQEHSESSFTAADAGKFHTAWNAMKDLQRREFVFEFGRPAKKYALTEEGWECARKIRKTQGLDTASILDPKRPAFMQSQQEHGSLGGALTAAALPRGGKQLVEAAGALDTPTARISSVQRHDRMISPAELPHNDDQDKARRSEEAARRPESGAPLARSINEPDFVELLSSSPPRPPTRQSLGELQDASLNSRGVAREPYASIAHSKPNAGVRRPSAERRDFNDAITIPPGSFTVELLLDTREVRSRVDRDYIQNQLLRHGIAPTTRALELGDCLWVARVHDPAVLMRLPPDEGPDLVLDHIAERKRLDDLIGSIKDGRFHEQKFRLARCGVPNVAYVVEHMTLADEVEQRWRKAVASAIAGTQAVDGFFVKRTKGLDASCRYLAHLTHTLRRHYAGRGLALVPAAALSEGHSGTASLATMLGGRPSAHRVALQTFAACVAKSASLTLGDVFLKMLMCTRGAAAHHALEIQRRWKTPREFVEALDKCGREAERRAVTAAAAEDKAQGRQKGKAKAVETPEEAAKRAKEEMVFHATSALVGKAKIGRATSERLGRIWGENIC